MRKLLNLKVKFIFSQTGEEIILNYLLREVPSNHIFYLDVGCNDPIRDSNTFLFYLHGGSGICIDGNGKLIEQFKKVRPNDISLSELVSDVVEEVTFYLSNESRVSTISEETMISGSDRWSYNENEKRKTKTLNEILQKHLPSNQEIHLLSIDVEGFDFKVLKSINLKKYQPRVIVIEIHEFELDYRFLQKNEIVTYLADYGYKLKYFAAMNAYFVSTK